jgi:hypothetical protein
VNVSVADKIPAEVLFAAIKGDAVDQKFKHHLWLFLDETDTVTIADLVAGGPSPRRAEIAFSGRQQTCRLTKKLVSCGKSAV